MRSRLEMTENTPVGLRTLQKEQSRLSWRSNVSELTHIEDD